MAGSGVAAGWSPATSQGLPLGTQEHPWLEGDEQRSPFWKLLCQSFGLGVTLIHRLSKVRFFWLRGGKHDTILGLLVLRWEGLQL